MLFDALVVQFQDRRFAPNFLLRAVPSRCAGFVTHVCIASYFLEGASSNPNSVLGRPRPQSGATVNSASPELRSMRPFAEASYRVNV